METVPEIEEYVFVCPFCDAKYTADSLMPPKPGKENFPNPDADDGKQRVVICIECCVWCVFYTRDDGRLDVRKPTYEEMTKLFTDPACVKATLEALIMRAMMRGEI